MDLTNIIIQLIIGAVGGNGAGMLLKKFSLGGLGNTIVGLLGGAGGAQILGAINPSLAEGLGGQIGGAGVGGAVLMIIVGMVKKMLAKQDKNPTALHQLHNTSFHSDLFFLS
ncbi:MAG: hypothetical protein KDK99_02190 [Verrucomicrobiales bacterium]|nr:hypothetical protein [Verrucomicrobiales bacterium]